MNNWKKDYLEYQELELLAYNFLIADKSFIQGLESMLPDVDILSTLEKSHREYWSTEDGWELKKKKRTKTINWKKTYRNACRMSFNQVKKGRAYDPKKALNQMGKMSFELERIFNG